MPVLPRGFQSAMGRSPNVSTTGLLNWAERATPRGPTPKKSSNINDIPPVVIQSAMSWAISRTGGNDFETAGGGWTPIYTDGPDALLAPHQGAYIITATTADGSAGAAFTTYGHITQHGFAAGEFYLSAGTRVSLDDSGGVLTVDLRARFNNES